MRSGSNLPNKDIDGEKLKALLATYCRDNKTSIVKMNEEMGYSKNYLHYACAKNTISQMAVFYLEAKGIKSEEYCIPKRPKIIVEKAPEKPKEKTIADLTPDEFKELIQTAMYEAFKSAWANA